MPAEHIHLACKHCHLPLPQSHFFAPKALLAENYCCFGCRLAYLLKTSTRTGPLAPSLQMGLGAIMTVLTLLVALMFQTTTTSPAIPENLNHGLRWTLWLLTTGTLLTVGLDFLKIGLHNIKKFSLPLESAISLMILVLYGQGVFLLCQESNVLPFTTLSVVIVMLITSHYLEAMGKQKSAQIITNVTGMRVATARKLVAGLEKQVPTSDLEVADEIRVYPEELIPHDGIIISGATSIDESALTGEMHPQLKAKGDEVIGGSYNRDGVIDIRTIHPHGSTVLDQIITTLKTAQQTPSPLENMTQRLALGWTGLIYAAALGALFFWMPQNKGMAMLYALGTLVIARPLWLSAGVSMSLAACLGLAAKKGVLAKSPQTMLALGRIHTLFFDKTGVLTRGELQYSNTALDQNTSQGDPLAYCFSLQKLSNHPMAGAMKSHPWYHDILTYPVENFASHAGLGLQGDMILDQQKRVAVAVGNLRFLKRLQYQISRPLRQSLTELESIGETVVLIGWERQIRALLSFGDTLRDQVHGVLSKIKSLGIEIAVITGDHEEAAKQLSSTLAVDHIYARCLPEEKAAKIKSRQESRKIVGMVGATYGDSAPMSQADVGILFAGGTELTSRSQDIHIIGHRLATLAWLISTAKSLLFNIRVNLFWNFFYLAAGLTLAVSGQIHPMIGAFTLVLSSMFTVSYSLSLRGQEEDRPAREPVMGGPTTKGSNRNGGRTASGILKLPLAVRRVKEITSSNEQAL